MGETQHGAVPGYQEAGRDMEVMGIYVLDHVIIGDGRHFSMKEAGHISG